MLLDPVGGRAAPIRGPLSICRITPLLMLLLLWRAPAARGQYVLEDVKDAHRYGPNQLVLPYAFYTPSDRFGGGFIWTTSGLLQPQASSAGLAFANLNNTYGVQGGQDDFQIHPVNRLFVSSQFGIFRYNFDPIYISGNRFFNGRPAGTNNSSDDNFIERRHNDDWGHVELKYLLPIGGGKDTVINHYMMQEGLVSSGQTGGHGYNPLVTGRTYLTLTPFFEYQSIDRRLTDERFNENGLRFGAVYDNTDFPLNPSSGNVTKLIVSRDFGVFDTHNPWTNISAEYSQFINLGHSPWFRQQVLALDGWTSYSVTWSQKIVNGQRVLTDAPPFYDGATLGGQTRLRGFAESRFWDRAAIYGSAELRLVPDWNPLGKIGFLKQADFAWMQWVIFGEVGRVGSRYSPDLFKHLKGDAGFGLRILANDTLIRIDVAASSEKFGIWVALNQPF